MPTPPPTAADHLPTTISYTQIMAAMQALAPRLDNTRHTITEVQITADNVTFIEWRHGRRYHHRVPIEHEQGAYTEGGHPSPTPPSQDTINDIIEGHR